MQCNVFCWGVLKNKTRAQQSILAFHKVQRPDHCAQHLFVSTCIFVCCSTAAPYFGPLFKFVKKNPS